MIYFENILSKIQYYSLKIEGVIHKRNISDKSVDFPSMMLNATLNSPVSSITMEAVIDLLKWCSCKPFKNHLRVEEPLTEYSCLPSLPIIK